MKPQTVIEYPGPFSVGPRKIVGALCPDGSQRTAHCSPLGADSFFSIPARVSAKGKTVAGYVMADDDEGARIWKFQPYRYRKNWRMVERSAADRLDDLYRKHYGGRRHMLEYPARHWSEYDRAERAECIATIAAHQK